MESKWSVIFALLIITLLLANAEQLDQVSPGNGGLTQSTKELPGVAHPRLRRQFPFLGGRGGSSNAAAFSSSSSNGGGGFGLNPFGGGFGQSSAGAFASSNSLGF